MITPHCPDNDNDEEASADIKPVLVPITAPYTHSTPHACTPNPSTTAKTNNSFNAELAINFLQSSRWHGVAVLEQTDVQSSLQIMQTIHASSEVDVGGSVTMGTPVTLRRNCRDSIAVVTSRSRHNYITSIYMYIKVYN